MNVPGLVGELRFHNTTAQREGLRSGGRGQREGWRLLEKGEGEEGWGVGGVEKGEVGVGGLAEAGDISASSN